MAAADRNVAVQDLANVRPEDRENVLKVRRLCELYHGRFTAREATTLLRHHEWDVLATNTFILDALPGELRDVLGENDWQLVENVRRNNVLRDIARLNRIGQEVRQYGCRQDDRVWWRRVPSRKPVSTCHTCRQKYEPIPRDQEWGLGMFECVCGNKFKAFAMMDLSILNQGYTGKSKSLCYRCMSHLCEPIQILYPQKRDRGRGQGRGRGRGQYRGQDRPQRRYTHRCTAPNCYNRYDPDPRSNEPLIFFCVHPNSLNGRVHGMGSDRHISTGSTVATFLSQGDIGEDYQPSLSGIDEEDSAEDDNG